MNRTVKEPRVSAADAILHLQLEKSTTRTVLEELNELVHLFGIATRDVVAFRSKAFHLLVRVYLPNPEVSEDEPARSAPFSWVRAICELELPNEVLDRTIVALCTALAYVDNPKAVSHARALDHYSDALRGLGATITDDASDNPEYTLASIVSLSTCEVLLKAPHVRRIS